MNQLADKILAGLAATCALALASMPAHAQPAADFRPNPFSWLSSTRRAAVSTSLAHRRRAPDAQPRQTGGRREPPRRRRQHRHRVGGKASADGYTLLETTNSYNINPLIYKNPGYDPRKDFAPVVQLTKAPSVHHHSPALAYRSVKDMVSAARAATRKARVRQRRQRLADQHRDGDIQVGRKHRYHTRAVQERGASEQGRHGRLRLRSRWRRCLRWSTRIRSGLLRALRGDVGEALADAARRADHRRERAIPEFSHMTWIGVFVPAGTPRRSSRG